jgi:hypothetical protein
MTLDALDIARQTLIAAQEQAAAARAQVAWAKWQVFSNFALAFIPVGVALWQLARAERLNFTTTYSFTSGSDGSWVEIFNNNGRAVRVTYYKVFWRVPAGPFRFKDELLFDAWREDEVNDFDIAAHGRVTLSLDQAGDFRWRHSNPRAKLCLRLWINGAERPVHKVVMDQRKADKEA